MSECIHAHAARALAAQLLSHVTTPVVGVHVAAYIVWKYTEDADPLFEYEAAAGEALMAALHGRKEEILGYIQMHRAEWAREAHGGSVPVPHGGEQSISVSPQVH